MAQLIITLVLLLITFVTGNLIERRHYEKIKMRELGFINMLTTNFENIPFDWDASEARLVTSNVVISLDYFKRFVANLRKYFGGNIVTYEPLMDRARREAVLRLKEKAKARGYNAIINLRLDTSQIANSLTPKQTAGVEILAYGTAIKINYDIENKDSFATEDENRDDPVGIIG